MVGIIEPCEPMGIHGDLEVGGALGEGGLGLVS